MRKASCCDGPPPTCRAGLFKNRLKRLSETLGLNCFCAEIKHNPANRSCGSINFARLEGAIIKGFATSQAEVGIDTYLTIQYRYLG